MRMMIIDDEKKIREGLQKYIAALDMGFQDIRVFDSGIHALEQLKNFAPDVMIVDILMPEMDGLDTIERIYQVLPQVQIIVISGISDFRYVRQSLNYSVVDYIPKPVQLSVLKAALNRVIRRIDEMNRQAKNAMQAQRILSITSYFQEQFLRSVLQGGYSNLDSLRTGLDKLELDRLKKGVYLIAALTPRREKTDDDSLKDISSLMAFVMERFSDHYIIPIDEMHLCILFHTSERSAANAYVERLENALTEILTERRVVLSAGLSEITEDIGKLNIAYRQAYDAMQLARIENSMLMLARDAQISDCQQSYFIGEDMEKAIRAAVIASDEGRLRRLVAICKDSLKHNYDANMLWHARLELIRVYINILHVLDDQSKTSLLIDLGIAHTLTTADQIMECFEDKLMQLLNKSTGKRASRAKQICEWMVQEINERYASPLSLTFFSDKTGLSVNYLSQIFIQNAGVSFITSLTSRRMMRATQLLKENRLTINQISEEIGYEDPNYFTRIFRKLYDCSPSEYRRENE